MNHKFFLNCYCCGKKIHLNHRQNGEDFGFEGFTAHCGRCNNCDLNLIYFNSRDMSFANDIIKNFVVDGKQYYVQYLNNSWSRFWEWPEENDLFWLGYEKGWLWKELHDEFKRFVKIDEFKRLLNMKAFW